MLFSLKCLIFPFPESDGQMGHLKEKHIEIGELLGKSHDRFQNRKGTEIETVWGISKKNHNTLT